jgi:homoserine O-acetyltransferase
MMLTIARSMLVTIGLALPTIASPQQTTWPEQKYTGVIMHDVRFNDGSMLANAKRSYVTIGTARRNAAAEITNAVLLLHGTSGNSSDWLRPATADPLFGRGKPLDAAKYYLIIPDGIGRAGSAKPSDGLKSQFPHYRYKDMIAADYRLLTEVLGIKHLRLVIGVSMGGMQSWMWPEMYPDFMDAAVPIASQPVAISGRNWMMRRVTIEAIRNDPEWKGGDYDKNPTLWTKTAPVVSLMIDSVVQLQAQAPDVESGNRMIAAWEMAAEKSDANDTLWGREAVEDYDPAPNLGRIKARILAMNFADDAVNPPELHTVESAVRRIPHAQFVLLPASPKTRGHLSYVTSDLWAPTLDRFLRAVPTASGDR